MFIHHNPYILWVANSALPSHWKFGEQDVVNKMWSCSPYLNSQICQCRMFLDDVDKVHNVLLVLTCHLFLDALFRESSVKRSFCSEIHLLY